MLLHSWSSVRQYIRPVPRNVEDDQHILDGPDDRGSLSSTFDKAKAKPDLAQGL